MAQALFDNHPLEEYLRSAGEASDFIPGSSAAFELELEPPPHMEHDSEQLEWRPLFFIRLTEMALTLVPSLKTLHHSSPFAERFKYDVISSSLLAVSLPSSRGHSPRRSIPGHLRTPSVEIQHPTTLDVHTSNSSHLLPSLSILVIILFNAGYTLLAVATLGATVYVFRTLSPSIKHDMTSVLQSLNDLIASSNEWESVVQQGISILENDEHYASYGSSSPSSALSLHRALQSSFHTTETQCDSIRHLFSALTLPSEVAQLSEMYAPPSPMGSTFPSQERSRRPNSLPVRRRPSSLPPDTLLVPQDIRSTWSGPHPNLASAESPSQLLRRREKRRSDLPSILSRPLPLASASAPVTPTRASSPINPEWSLSLINEEAKTGHDTNDITQEDRPFGAIALELHRLRKGAGMEALRSPPPSYLSALSPPPAASSLSSGSRYTSMQSPRHQLSLTALNQALQGAMASKRYACSHLLALRFSEEEDEGYWEDVRSVIALLTSTLVDASSRLTEALEHVERENLKDQSPTPALVTSFQVFEGDEENGSRTREDRRRSFGISFAPLPSHLSRFAAHVEAITTSLNDAQDHLQDCVTFLRQEQDAPPAWRDRPWPPHPPSANVEGESGILQAYDRLRRELGLALRECERGKGRLLDVIYPPKLCDEEDDGDWADDLPALGHDASDSSDKPDMTFPFDEEVESERAVEYMVNLEGTEGALDDATAHLLLTTSTQHLPPAGIEQVFEADTGDAAARTRERSKLTREERIKLAKARRESGGGVLAVGMGMGLTPMPEKAVVEKWGPGGEVVQELKDVIWKVGERRRKMAGSPPSQHIAVLSGDVQRDLPS